MKKYMCPCCGYKTLTTEQPGMYEICPICFWEDDPIQFDNPYSSGGANKVSLAKAQSNYVDFGACDVDMIKNVRKPMCDDIKDGKWVSYESPIDRDKEMVIDLRAINSMNEFHNYIKEKLEFPNFYGRNWDAFWDAITGLISMPDKLIFIGWHKFEKDFPKDARILKNLFIDFNSEYPIMKCEILYK